MLVKAKTAFQRFLSPLFLYAATIMIPCHIAVAGDNIWTSNEPAFSPPSARALVVDPSNPQIVYAAASGGLYKSLNGGNSWTQINTGLTTNDVRDLVMVLSNPRILYAGTYNGGIFKSTDSGDSWTRISDLALIQALAIDPSNSQILYAGTYGGSYKSVNGGGTWTVISTGLPSSSIRVFSIDPSNPQIIYAGTFSGLFKSTNGGSSWNDTGLRPNNGVPAVGNEIYVLAISQSNPRIIYAGRFGLFKSMDGGNSWTNTSLPNFPMSALAVDPSNSQIVYAGTERGGGVFKSTDGGNSWTPIIAGLPNLLSNPLLKVAPLTIAPSNPQTIYAGVEAPGIRSGIYAITFTSLLPTPEISPSSLTFGDVQINQSKSLLLTVTNKGSSTLSVTGAMITGTDASQFKASPTTLIVPPNQSATMTVTFTPTLIGGKSSSLSIAHNATGSPSIVALSGNGTSPVISLSTTSLPFGNVQKGQTKSLTFTVENTGNTALSVSSVARIGTSDTTMFTVSPTSFTVNAGSVGQTVTVTFSPTSEGNKSATLSIVHNAAGNPSTVSLTGNGTAEPPPPAPIFNISATSLTMDNTVIGSSSEKQFTITNTGNADLSVTSITISGTGTNASQFKVAPTALTVSPGKSGTVTVTFSPTGTSGSRSATLSVAHNATGSSSTVTLSGTGVSSLTPGTAAISISPSSLSFGNVTIGQTASQEISIKNTGTGTLTISAAFSPDDIFTLSPAPPYTISANGSQAVTVKFTPTVTGDKSSNLVISHNGTNTSSPLLYPISGTGVAAPLVDFSVTNTTGRGELEVRFTLKVQNVLIRSIRWDFGDGETSKDPHPEHFYRAPGVYTVRVDVTTEGGEVLTKIKEKFITVSELQAGITVSSTSLSFGDVQMGQSKTMTFTVGNTGKGTLKVSNITLDGTNPSQFSVSPTLLTVNAGNPAQMVTVTFAPTSTGTKSASLSIVHNAPGGPAVVSLNGNGIQSIKKTEIEYVSGGTGEMNFGSNIEITVRLKVSGSSTFLPNERLTLNIFSDIAGINKMKSISTQTDQSGQVRFQLPTLEYKPYGTPSFVREGTYYWNIEYEGSSAYSQSKYQDILKPFKITLKTAEFSLSGINPSGFVKKILINNNANEGFEFVLDVLISSIDSYYTYVMNEGFNEPFLAILTINIQDSGLPPYPKKSTLAITHFAGINIRSSSYKTPDGFSLKGLDLKTVISHEMMHTIQWKNWGISSIGWVGEGIAVLGSDLCGFGNSTLQDTHQGASGISLFDIDSTYGNVYLFFRYLYEKYGGTKIIKRIIEQNLIGGISPPDIITIVDALRASGFNISFDEVFKRWTIDSYIGSYNRSSTSGKRPVHVATLYSRDNYDGSLWEFYSKEKGVRDYSIGKYGFHHIALKNSQVNSVSILFDGDENTNFNIAAAVIDTNTQPYTIRNSFNLPIDAKRKTLSPVIINSVLGKEILIIVSRLNDLLGSGLYNINIQATLPTPEINLSSLTFGDVEVGKNKQMTLTVSNKGGSDLSVSGITISGTDASLFSVSAKTMTVPSNQSKMVTVTFAPTSAGDKKASLSIAHNASGSPSLVNLSGNGISITILGDLDDDGGVDFNDFFLFSAAFGSSRGKSNYNEKADLDKDGDVDFNDFFLFSAAFVSQK